MFQQTYLPSEVVADLPATARSYKFTARNLLDNVIFIAYNQSGGVILKKGLTSAILNPGDTHAGLFLKKSYNSSTGDCFFGADTSYDPDQNYNSASLKIEFFDSVPPALSSPRNVASTSQFFTDYLGTEPDYYLDLKALAGNRKYCRVQVKPDPNYNNHSLIEGSVKLILATSSNHSSESLVQIYGTEPPGAQSQDKGLPDSRITNRDFYVNLAIEQEVYLFGMVNYTKRRNTYSFYIGDPRDAADIDVEEV